MSNLKSAPYQRFTCSITESIDDVESVQKHEILSTTPAFNSSDTSEADVDYPELDLDKYTILADDYDPFGALLGEANSEEDSADELDMEAREEEEGGMNRWKHFYGCLWGGGGCSKHTF